MSGNALTNASDAIADAKLIYLRTNGGHESSTAVTESRGRPETFLDLPHRGAEPLSLKRLDNLPNLVRPLTGLSSKIHSCLSHLHLLGAHADE
jgi:hypothetical protein